MAMRRLDELTGGDTGVVAHVAGDSPVSHRLMEMGMVPGAEVQVLRFAPWGDPMMVNLDGYHLSLRKAEAALISLSV